MSKLKSNFHLFNFKKLNQKMIFYTLKKILVKEKIGYETEALDKISKSSKGDMRIIINILEKLSNNYNLIKKENFDKFVEYGNTLLELKFLKHLFGCEVDTVFKISDDQFENGYTNHEIIVFFNGCLDEIDIDHIFPENFKVNIKLEIKKTMNKTDTNYIQLYGFYAKILQ